MIIANARVVAGDRILAPGWLRVDGQYIAEFGEGTPIGPTSLDPDPCLDLEDNWLVPGFVDMHAHGAVGHSFDEADAAAVEAITRHHLAHGTTSMVASLVSAPVGVLEHRVRALAPLVAGGTLAGVHLEGPFLSTGHRGAHDPRYLVPPTPAALDRLLAAAPAALRMITLAPELPGGLDAVKRIVNSGVVAAIGHTSADYETALAAIDRGASVATHLYNGMPPILGRAPGPVAALTDDERIVVELIADGFHLHEATLRRTAAVTATAGRFALVTDAMSATGCGDGDYLLGEQRVRVTDGLARLVDGDSLAGSTLTLDRALRTAVRAGVDFRATLAAVTATPARALGLAEHCGTIAVGRAADLVVLDGGHTVRGVLRRGEWVQTDRAGLG